MIGPEQSLATRYFALYPELRQRVLDSSLFKEKLEKLEAKSFTIDGEKLYFPWGDTPKGIDDLMLDELLDQGVVTTDSISRELEDR
jgi:hypothetical protein